MKKKPTMRAIAERLGVSTVTVSKALSDKEGVSDTLREEIKRVAEEMGYGFNMGAKGMKEGCTYNVGVIVAGRHMDASNSFYWGIYQSLIQELRKNNYYTLLEIISKKVEKENRLPNMVEDKRVDALIVLGQVKESYIDFILKQDMPLVFLDFHEKHVDVDTVIGDNMYGAYTITNYLVANGHKEIGYVGNIYATNIILDKYLGYQKALIENRLPMRADWIINDRDEEGRFRDFVLPEQFPTAFVCNCDEVAYYFIQHLNRIGIQVPENVSVVGYDDDLYATISKPQFTTVYVDVESMAKEAVNAILKKIINPAYKLGRKVITGKMVTRDSVKVLSK